jgi:two-component system cell cycle sensor histidine kinase/response regulator CckA
VRARPVPVTTSDAPVRVLVVDDEERVRILMVRLARALGYHAVSVPSAAEALLWLETEAVDVVVADATEPRHRVGDGPSLVITDVRMPGMDGCTLGRTIVRRWPEVRMLFVSGYLPEELQRFGICPDDMPFLPKPFLRSEFKDAIEQVLAAPPWHPADGGTTA